MTKFLSVVFLAISASASSVAIACDCRLPSLSEQYRHAHIVFLGEVVSIENKKWEKPKFFLRVGTQETKMRVLETFKSELPSEITVNNELDYSTCSMNFRGPGQVRLIFLDSAGGIGGPCGGTRDVRPGEDNKYYEGIFKELRLLKFSQFKSPQYLW